MLLKQPMDHLRNQRLNEKKKTPRNKWKWNRIKPIGLNKSSSKKEVYSDKNLSQKARKVSDEKPNLASKSTRERKTSKTQN